MLILYSILVILILILIVNGVSLCWHVTDGAKPMVSKIDSLTGTETLAPNSTNSHSTVHCYALTANNKIRVINFLKFQPSSTHLFNILCEKMESIHKALLLQTEVWQLPWGKVKCAVVWVLSRTSCFFHEAPLFSQKSDWQATHDQADLDLRQVFFENDGSKPFTSG